MFQKYISSWFFSSAMHNSIAIFFVCQQNLKTQKKLRPKPPYKHALIRSSNLQFPSESLRMFISFRLKVSLQSSSNTQRNWLCFTFHMFGRVQEGALRGWSERPTPSFHPPPRDHQDGGWRMITYFTWFLQCRENPSQLKPKMFLIMASVGNELVPSSWDVIIHLSGIYSNSSRNWCLFQGCAVLFCLTKVNGTHCFFVLFFRCRLIKK